MLNPLVRWEPGTPVTYHGSLTDLHGEYRAFPCMCLRCVGPHGESHRFELRSGDTTITCVRARSITNPFMEVVMSTTVKALAAELNTTPEQIAKQLPALIDQSSVPAVIEGHRDGSPTLTAAAADAIREQLR